LYWGGHVVQGTCLALVTAIGPNTLVSTLIREKRFPASIVRNPQFDAENPDPEDGIALIGQSA